MTDPVAIATVAVAALAGLTVLALVALRAWAQWIDLQRLALGGARPAAEPASPGGARIELADLRERVRKLEAIASGVDL